eukprot:TRINITY_DN55727_c0_g1_i1.p1 TRINITY_DN55727_c0_g1~~TRINITY_DN55727_c0_g1_i1.p1  ORF type:complete len:764 (+),score=151.21 TRINITY_DN55727_c0_g1_i1:112-2292(+)
MSVTWRRRAPPGPQRGAAPGGEAAPQPPAEAAAAAGPDPPPAAPPQGDGGGGDAAASAGAPFDDGRRGDSMGSPATPSTRPADAGQSVSPGGSVTSPSYPSQPVLMQRWIGQHLGPGAVLALDPGTGPPSSPGGVFAPPRFVVALRRPAGAHLQPGSPSAPLGFQAIPPFAAHGRPSADPGSMPSLVSTSLGTPSEGSPPATAAGGCAAPLRPAPRAPQRGQWVLFETVCCPGRCMLGRIDPYEPDDPDGVAIAALGGWFVRRPPDRIRKAYLVMLDLPAIMFWRAQECQTHTPFVDDFLNFLFARFAVGLWSSMPAAAVQAGLPRVMSAEQRRAFAFICHHGNAPSVLTLWGLEEHDSPRGGGPPQLLGRGCRKATHGWKQENTLVIDGGEGAGKQGCLSGNAVHVGYPRAGQGPEGPLLELRFYLGRLIDTGMDVPGFVRMLPQEWRTPTIAHQDPALRPLLSHGPGEAPAERSAHRVARLRFRDGSRAVAAALELLYGAAVAQGAGAASAAPGGGRQRGRRRVLAVVGPHRGFRQDLAEREVLDKLAEEFGLGQPGPSREWWPRHSAATACPPAGRCPPAWALRQGRRVGADQTRDARSRTPPVHRGGSPVRGAAPDWRRGSPGRRSPPRSRSPGRRAMRPPAGCGAGPSGIPPAAELRRLSLNALEGYAHAYGVHGLSDRDELITALSQRREGVQAQSPRGTTPGRRGREGSPRGAAQSPRR